MQSRIDEATIDNSEKPRAPQEVTNTIRDRWERKREG